MKTNIVIFNPYFLHGVVDMLENISLTVALHSVPTHAEALHKLTTLPNLLGLLSIDHQPTNKSPNFYKKVVDILDVIGEAQKRSLTLSVLHRSKLIPNMIAKTHSSAVDIHMYKYVNLTEEQIRLDGLVPIILNHFGVFKRERVDHFTIEQGKTTDEQRSSFINAFVYIASEDPDDIAVAGLIKRHPELRFAYSLTKNDDHYENCKKRYKESIYMYFCELIRRTRDEKIKSNY